MSADDVADVIMSFGRCRRCLRCRGDIGDIGGATSALMS
jgi:hypothetical protein